MIERRHSLSLVPAPSLYVGIDVSKKTHYAALVSNALLEENQDYRKCPSLSFANSRDGFEALLTFLHYHGVLAHCLVILEQTGHYHHALQEFLEAQGVPVYVLHAQKPLSRTLKTDKRDAQNLALLLFNQLERGGVQVMEASQIARHKEFSPAAIALRGLVHQRGDLVQETTRCKNRLTSICDEVFPEFTQVIKDPNGKIALRIREKYPTPQDLAEASLDDLLACRGTAYSKEKLCELQRLAAQSVGIRHPARLSNICLEQTHLIEQLRMLERQQAKVEALILPLVASCREGQILTSFPMIGPIQAGTLLAFMGSISNFERASKLKSFLGWSPTRRQTGTSKDATFHNKRGNRLLKQAMYFIGWHALRLDPASRALYDRKKQEKSVINLATGKSGSGNRALGRVIGRLSDVIYHLLKVDYDLLASLPEGEEPPPPTLYDPHRQGRKHQAED